jgi:hypothetical protein
MPTRPHQLLILCALLAWTMSVAHMSQTAQPPGLQDQPKDSATPPGLQRHGAIALTCSVYGITLDGDLSSWPEGLLAASNP